MKILTRIPAKLYKLLLTIMLSSLSFVSLPQSPTHIPRQNPEPVGFFDSIENIVFYVVIPIVIVILYFFWRKQRKKHNKEQEDDSVRK